MAASDATFCPRRNTAFRATFPILDGAGNLVTGATGLDSEVSKDQGTFADCTNEATEIATSSGIYYLDLTATEMDADTVAVQVKTTSTGAKTTVLVLYTTTRDIDDLAFPTTSGRSIDVTTTGEVGVDLDNAAGTLDAAQFGADCLTAAKIADGAIDAATFAAGAINAAAIAADAIGASELAADAVSEIQSGLATSSALTTAQADLDDIQTRLPAALVSGRMDSSVGAMAAGVVTAAAVATDAIDGDAVAASAVSEIQSGLATAAEVAAVQADTDDIQTRLPAALVSGRIDASVGAMANDVVTAAAVATDAIGSAELAASAVTEIADGVLDRAVSEPSGIFAWPASLRSVIAWLGVINRNKKTQTSTTTSYRNDADSATLATRTVSDDGTTFTAGEAT